MTYFAYSLIHHWMQDIFSYDPREEARGSLVVEALFFFNSGL
jgi:hypothetical protein